MKNETRAVQVRQIVRQLASLPGGKAVDVIARKWPRLGPAEPNTSYRVDSRSFQIADLPEFLSIPSDCEEIIIRLSGALDEPKARSVLVDELNALFSEYEFRHSWDVRAQFNSASESKSRYTLTVFSSLERVRHQEMWT